VAVYLLHFDRPYHHARHYIGFTTDLEGRLALHARPNGSSNHRLMQVIFAAGITWRLGRVWPNADRLFERRLKRRKEAPRLCPICSTRPRPCRTTKDRDVEF
jgi:hypothetical protein